MISKALTSFSGSIMPDLLLWIKVVPDPDFVKECIQKVFIRVWETRETLADAENCESIPDRLPQENDSGSKEEKHEKTVGRNWAAREFCFLI